MEISQLLSQDVLPGQTQSNFNALRWHRQFLKITTENSEITFLSSWMLGYLLSCKIEHHHLHQQPSPYITNRLLPKSVCYFSTGRSMPLIASVLQSDSSASNNSWWWGAISIGAELPESSDVRRPFNHFIFSMLIIFMCCRKLRLYLSMLSNLQQLNTTTV